MDAGCEKATCGSIHASDQNHRRKFAIRSSPKKILAQQKYNPCQQNLRFCAATGNQNSAFQIALCRQKG
jgi:hypothetical protein